MGHCLHCFRATLRGLPIMPPMRARAAACSAFFAVWLLCGPSVARAADDLLPDMTSLPDVLSEIQIDDVTQPGQRLLRLSAATPNIGQGRLEIRGSTPLSDTRQEVVQRVYRTDGTFSDRSAGTSTYHPAHFHVHFDNWMVYRLRSVTPSGGVGDIVAEGAKTSFCLSDLVVYDASNPFFSPAGNYRTCNFTVQGITPGWMDIYDLTLPDQWIDITGVPDGVYWLEAEVDPLNKILESDETNNVGRIKVFTGTPPLPVADRYEENDSPADVDARPEGLETSPNLGPVGLARVLDKLSMDDQADYFKFHLAETAGLGGFVRIDSPYLLGSDLDLILLDSNGAVLSFSASDGNLEQVSLASQPAGDYYAWVTGFGTQNPEYRLTIDPSGHFPPTLDVTAPPQAGAWVERGVETLAVTWTASDPESRPITVSLSIDRDQQLDKGTRALQGYQTLEGEGGLTYVNTAGLDLGTWYLFAEATNGGGRSSDWAPGPFVVYQKGDVNFDGVVDRADLRLARRECLPRGSLPPGWDHILDMDRDGHVDRADFRLLWSAIVQRDTQGDTQGHMQVDTPDSDDVSLLSRKRSKWFVRRGLTRQGAP